jgi:hypothetical protein
LTSVERNQRSWNKHLIEALWAYTTTYKVAISFTLFKLAYGFKALIPIELEIPLLQVTKEYGLNEGAPWKQG